MTNPTLYMLIGLPASGKSSWREDFLDKKHADGEPWYDYEILSTDDWVEKEARLMGSTYSETWPKYIGTASKILNELCGIAVERNANIIWDQTNLTLSSRAKKLKQIPSNYHKIAVVFKKPDDEEYNRRLENRPGKTIDKALIENMVKTYECPYFDEGFDEIWYEN